MDTDTVTSQRVILSFALGAEKQISVTDIGISSANARWVNPNRQVARIIADVFSEVPQVQSICVQFGSDFFTVWTLLSAYDPAARERVYERELRICELLNVYDFDFRVSSIDLVSPAELVDTGSVEIFRRA